jgi:hypothetical protein
VHLRSRTHPACGLAYRVRKYGYGDVWVAAISGRQPVHADGQLSLLLRGGDRIFHHLWRVGRFGGLALLAGLSAARALALWAGFLSLPELPLGLMLGVYTVVRLLPTEPVLAA